MKVSRLLVMCAALPLALLLAPLAPSAQTGPVTLDVVVVDKEGKPATGLQQNQFEVRDDGQSVKLEGFEAVTVAPGKRTVIFVLDNIGVPAPGTTAIQNITKFLLGNADISDTVSVVTLNGKDEGLPNDVPTVMARIDAYQGGSAPANRDTPRISLEFMGSLAEKLQAGARGRKAIVCVGSLAMCNVPEPGRATEALRVQAWNRVISSAARSNVAFYNVVPAAQVGITAGGLAEITGGDVLAIGSNVQPVAERIWSDAAGHYLLTYQPTTKEQRDLYRVEVRVQGGMRAFARRYRGK